MEAWKPVKILQRKRYFSKPGFWFLSETNNLTKPSGKPESVVFPETNSVLYQQPYHATLYITNNFLLHLKSHSKVYPS